MKLKKLGYDEGLNSLCGEDFLRGFLSHDNMRVKECLDVVLILMKCHEIEMIVEKIFMPLSEKDRYIIEDRISYWWIKSRDSIVIDFESASEVLGCSYNVFDFLVNVSSAIGRVKVENNTFVLTTELLGLDVSV